ncbi:hypothetical protein ABZ570_02810 [Micromonospora sp. NPDC007271]|uniref:hypothetical protein n=1 Tax=Micromonospora sp. NPDC007271 TaxID=3154587 RepID=UPI0033C0F0AB
MSVVYWFEIERPGHGDNPEDFWTFTDEEEAFVSVIRERTEPWASDGISSLVSRPEDESSLLVAVSLVDAGRILVDVGVHLTGDRVQGDRLHSELYTLPDVPSAWALDLTGAVEQLGQAAADWFIAALRRPVLLYVWLNDDRNAYAARYAFADTDETLCQAWDDRLAPRGRKRDLIAAGHVRGRGWVQVEGLPAPELYVHVRGDLDTAVIPDGAQPTSTRGGLPGLWYE